MFLLNRGLALPRASVLLVALLVGGCAFKDRIERGSASNQESPLMVYCAAGIRLPVEAAAKEYQSEYGRTVQIDYGSSGELEGRLEIDQRSAKSRCDLYIPADLSFAQRTRDKGLTQESLTLAQFRLVLAVKPDSELAVTNVDELIQSGASFVVCDKQAGVGKKTFNTLQRNGKWERVDAKKKASFPRVTEAANAIKSAGDAEAGFIWDTTAHQFGLKILELEELQQVLSNISVNVVAGTKRPAAALHFARYLAAKDRGQKYFEKFGFTPAGTDMWGDKPELIVYCGGVNRNAIDKTLRDFEAREAVTIKEQYGGCGTLVTGINAIAQGDIRKGMPDAFMTCDTSYMTKVQDFFDIPSDVSATQVVMLVRKGNPKRLTSLQDLANKDLAIGTTNPKMSTLGDLSWQLFESAGIREQVEANKSVIVMTPTAHELIMQMTGHGKLDVALVYEANCQNISDEFEIVRIEHPRAIAIQNIATARNTQYPALTSRLLAAIKSADSQKRFEAQGFQWRVQPMTP